MAFAADGKTAAGFSRGEKPVIVWDLEKGGKVGEYAVPPLAPGTTVYHMSLAFTDGTLIAVARRESMVIIWEPVSGKMISRIEETPEPVISLAFSSDGKTLYSAGSRLPVTKWDVATGRRGEVLYTKYKDTTAKNIARDPWDRAFSHGGNRMALYMWTITRRLGSSIWLRNGLKNSS